MKVSVPQVFCAVEDKKGSGDSRAIFLREVSQSTQIASLERHVKNTPKLTNLIIGQCQGIIFILIKLLNGFFNSSIDYRLKDPKQHDYLLMSRGFGI